MKHEVKALSKEEVLANRSNAYEFIDFDKQETLEEAAKEFLKHALKNRHGHLLDSLNTLIYFAKWQEQRMYSEEDMREAFKKGHQVGVYLADYKTDEVWSEWLNNLKRNKL